MAKVLAALPNEAEIEIVGTGPTLPVAVSVEVNKVTWGSGNDNNSIFVALDSQPTEKIKLYRVSKLPARRANKQNLQSAVDRTYYPPSKEAKKERHKPRKAVVDEELNDKEYRAQIHSKVDELSGPSLAKVWALIAAPDAVWAKQPLDAQTQDDNAYSPRATAIEVIASLPADRVAKAFEAVAKLAESELPVVAPALWAERPKGMKAVAFYREHWSCYADKGLTRNLIRQLDRAFYQTISTWLSRQDSSNIPDDLKILLETRSDRLDGELAAANIIEPLDAFKAFPDDRQTAMRLYQAALARKPA